MKHFEKTTGVGFRVTYINRGAPGDQTTAISSDIAQILKGSFLLEDGETQIPFHRVILIWGGKDGVPVTFYKHDKLNRKLRIEDGDVSVA